MSSEDREAQEDELLALAGIYDEDEFKRAESSQGGEFRICLTLPPKFRVLVDGRNEQVIYMVDFLPPVVLKFELPVDYPSSSAPTFTLQCKWLSETQLTSLCTHLDEIWEENRGCVVLFSWMQFLKDEVLSFLNISSSLLLKPAEIRRGYHQPLTSEEAEQTSFAEAQDTVGPSFCDPRAIQDVEAWTNILPEILDFNHHQKQKKFNSTIYSCKICFLEKLGSDCLCFNKCEHVYCNNCLREYFEIQIKDGMVQSLICPEPKCHSVATPAQVKQLVGEEAFSRYDRLLLQNGLSLMTDIVYCPRLSCQTAVLKEPDSEMGVCTSCLFVFCSKCNLTYHGVAPCRPEVEEQDSQVSENESPDDDEEQNYKLIYTLSRRRQAQWYQNEKWVTENAKRCPNCRSPAQKDGGCNIMTCSRCGSFFCWMCLAQLNEDRNSHFREKGSPCYKNLQV